MSKWNERLVTSFLKAYKQHPCLWNPYHRDYYNCREKNEAMQKIINDLNIPGFTATDYIQQIKSIREKYKQEQMRTMKSLHSQKHYKSPFAWYNIVANMLTKVIADEEKAQQRETTPVHRSLSSDSRKNTQRKGKVGANVKFLKIRPCNQATCDQFSRRSKSVEKPSRFGGICNAPEKMVIKKRSEKNARYVPCSQFITEDSNLRDREEDELLSYKPTRDIEPEVTEHFATAPNTMDPEFYGTSLMSKDEKSYGSPLLKCPQCGWEDGKYEGIEETAGKYYIPCSGYNKNHSSGIYSMCIGCDKVTRDDAHYRMKVTDLPEYSKSVDNLEDFEISQDLMKRVTRTTANYKTVPFMSAAESAKMMKDYADVAVQYEEYIKKILKDDIPVAKSIQTQSVQGDPIMANELQYGTREAFTQLKMIFPESKKSNSLPTRSTSWNTQPVDSVKLESSTKETQFSFKNESKMHETGVNTVNCVEKEVQNTVCISDGTRKCVSLQTLNQLDQQETEKDKQRLTESKEVAVNIVDQVSQGVQSTICVSRGSLAYRTSLEKMIECGTTMSSHQIRNVGCMTADNIKELKSKFVQCIPKEKFQSLIRAKSHNSLKRVRDTDLKHSEKGIEPSETPCTTDTCPLNILNLAKEDPVVASVLQQFIQNTLFKHEHGTHSATSNEQTDYEYKHHQKRNCFIDATELVNIIKEYTTKSVTKDNLKEFIQKFDVKSFSQEVEGKRILTETDTSTIRDSKSTMTDESTFKPIFHSTIRKESKGQGIMEDETLLLEKMKREYTMVDKEVCTCFNCKDVGINGSLMQLPTHDMEIQSNLQLLKDFGCLAKCERKVRVSVGTQKRDPILIRVIKCNENQAIVRSDKETLTVCTDVNFGNTCINKRLETCGRPTCNPPTVCRRSNEYENQVCDKNCKFKMYYDCSNVTNMDIVSNVTNSKIPMCMKLRKSTCVRNK